MSYPIAQESLKWMRSERTGKGQGGRMSGLEIVWGQSNSLHPDVDEVAFATGRVWRQKAFGFVDTLGQEVLYGAYVCITEPPANPNVSASVIPAGWLDYDADHVAYLSSYLANGARLRMWPDDVQIQGANTLRLWTRPELPLPEIGRTYVLVSGEGTSGEVQQAVMIDDITWSIQTFSDPQGDYPRKIVIAQLAEPLRYAFSGPPVSRLDPVNPSTVVRDTVVANAARLYSIATLTEPASVGDYTLQVDRTDAQVVPASVRETVALDVNAAARSPSLVPAAGGYVEFDYALSLGPGDSLYLGLAAAPGTLSITAGPIVLTERQKQLWSGTTAVGTVDLSGGVVTFAATAPPLAGTKRVRFKPAAVVVAPLQSGSILITQANRGRFYTALLPTRPQPGSLLVAYMSGGRWYELYDNADGTLSGVDQAYGSGQLSNFNSLVLSLGEKLVPDVGSRIIYWWSHATHTTSYAGQFCPRGAFEIVTAQPIPPNGLTLSWEDGAKTATDDGDGRLTGDAVGAVYYGSNRIVFRPLVLPGKGSQLKVTITPRTRITEIHPATPRDSSGALSLTFEHQGIVPGSVEFDMIPWSLPTPPAYTPLPEPPAAPPLATPAAPPSVPTAPGQTPTPQPTVANPTFSQVPAAPSLVLSSGGTAQYGYTFHATDPDGHTIAYSLSETPPGTAYTASIGSISGQFVFSATAAGTYTFVVRATTDDGRKADYVFSVAVAAGTPPVSTLSFTSSPPTAGTVGTALSYTAQATDTAGHGITYSIHSRTWPYALYSSGNQQSGPTAKHFPTLGINSGILTFVPYSAGNYQLTIQATTDDGRYVLQNLAIEVP